MSVLKKNLLPPKSEKQATTKISAQVYQTLRRYTMMNVTAVITWNLRKCSKIDAQMQFIQIMLHVVYGPVSVVGTATSYVLDGPGIESWWDEIFRTRPGRPWGPPSLLYNGYRAIPGLKRPECGVDHPPASSAEVKYIELYLCSPVGLHGLLQGELFYLIHCFTWNRDGVGIMGWAKTVCT